MRVLSITFCFFFLSINFSFANETKYKSFFDFKVKDVQGKEVNLDKYKNKVILVVNTASACGFTPQLKDLEMLQQKYAARGFTVIAFPSNDFKQDQGNNAEIEKFAKEKYQITFPIMDKKPVSGKEKQAVYQFLTDSKTGFLLKEVQWNFEKFLIGKDGQVIDRWNSITSPKSDSIVKKIEAAL